MRPRANSQAGRILALLEQGGWWSTSDLLREVPSIVHSRIAGLRDQGFAIEHKTTGVGAPHSLYRLLPQTKAASATGEGIDGGPSALVFGNRPSQSVPRAPDEPSPPASGGVSAAGDAPAQLALELPARLREEAA